jgi:hypothetical protein
LVKEGIFERVGAVDIDIEYRPTDLYTWGYWKAAKNLYLSLPVEKLEVI